MTANDILTSGGLHPERTTDPECTQQVAFNASVLAIKVTGFLQALGAENIHITSGFRTIASNKAAGGSPRSSHLSGEAVDISDPDGVLADGITLHKALLKSFALYMEDPAHTHGWVHLTTRSPPSGNLIFIP